MKAIEKISLIESVVTELKQAIMDGSYRVGDKFLTELKIGEILGIGRSTVREALRLLQAMGYLEIKPGKGAFVLRITEYDQQDVSAWFSNHITELNDYIEVRMAIEPLALRLAIARSDKDDLDELKNIHKSFVRAMAENNVEELAKCDELFHTTIVKLSRNKLLKVINESIAKFLAEYRIKAFSVSQNVPHALKPHAEIIDCIEKGDSKRAEEIMLEHLKISLADIQNTSAD
jgi:GntR family transcriptional repressor for pyruvate dehydrogenase complex